MKNIVLTKEEIKIYWSKAEAETAEGSWGNEHYFNDLENLLLNCKGRVLDLACFTSEITDSLSKFPYLQIKGHDFSASFIMKAMGKEVFLMDRPYWKHKFDFSYSIGQLEYFPERGVFMFLEECVKYTKSISFHMVPISDSNEIDLWLPKFTRHFSKVYVINSVWEDPGKSVGKWFVCIK